MTLVKFKQPASRPFNSLIDNILADFPSVFRNEFTPTARHHSVPVNIRETENGYQLDIAAPGFNKEDFKVNVEKNILTVSALSDEKTSEEKTNEVKYLRREFKSLSFSRYFTLDETLDTEKIEAKYVNGLLTVNLYKKEETKTPVKQVTIQ